MLILAVQMLIPIRCTEEQQKEISYGQVRQQEIGRIAHVSIPRDDDDDENISGHTDKEDDAVEDASGCL